MKSGNVNDADNFSGQVYLTHLLHNDSTTTHVEPHFESLIVRKVGGREDLYHLPSGYRGKKKILSFSFTEETGNRRRAEQKEREENVCPGKICTFLSILSFKFL